MRLANFWRDDPRWPVGVASHSSGILEVVRDIGRTSVKAAKVIVTVGRDRTPTTSNWNGWTSRSDATASSWRTSPTPSACIRHCPEQLEKVA
jgi:hypothetical protein